MTPDPNLSKANTIQGSMEDALLSVPYPIVQFTGMELRVSYANDALLSLWGKDKSIIGQTYLEILPEHADQPFPALLRSVIESGVAHTDSEAVAYLMKDGVLQPVYFDYSFTVVRNLSGENTGVMVVCKDVTEQVLARQKLEDSEARFRSMVMQAPFAIAVLHGREFVIEMANSNTLNIWGKENNVLGKQLAEVFPELIAQGFLDILRNVFDSGKPFYGNEYAVTLLKDGEMTNAFLNFVYHPIIENKQVTSIMSVGYDVTDLVLSRRSAEKQKELLENLNRAGEELALTLDTDSALQKISELLVPNFADWFTINILKDDILELLLIVNSDEEYVQWAKEFRIKVPVTINNTGVHGHVIRTGESVLIPRVTDEIIEAAIKDKEQLAQIKKMQLRSSIVVPMTVGTRIIGSVNFVSTVEGREYDEMDLNFAKDFATRIALALENARLHESAQQEIAERKKAEFALRESEEQFRSLSNAIPQLAWMSDKDGWIFWYNDRWYDYTGTNLEEMQGWGWEKIHHPDHKQRVVDFAQEAWKKEKPFEITFPLRGKTGEWRWFLTRAEPIFDIQGNLVRWFGTNTDITEQKEALEQNETLLKEMEFERNRFEAVVKQMPGSVVIAEAPTGKIIFSNDKIKDIWGHPLKQSENVDQYIEWVGFHPDGRQYEGHEWPLARSIQSGEIVIDEDVDIIRHGEQAILRLSSAPILDNSRNIIAGVVVSQDVTELKKAVRTRDEFLSIASHELKTPLTTLTASIQLLMRVYGQHPTAPAVASLIETSFKSAGKLGSLISELLNVSKIESGQLKLSRTTFNLFNVVSECCEFVRLQGSHTLVLEGNRELDVFADRQRIEQVIVNFVNNAVKYAPESNLIKLVIEETADSAKLTVIDQGIGIDEAKLPHLFERYFRVDPSGIEYSGLGLGLYISSEIIKLHGGKVGVESKLDEGSAFWFTIPFK
ncbi:MAG: PAS domain S-box protein [Daejeonella sp.]|uniref:PAS domain S-box protein n=1 Tax=Daejeonella sp. TaxID=2805397 RepID=UPI003C749DC1